MDEKAMGFNEGQLKRTGFAEAFTPELKAQMEQGVAVIQHNFKKEYDGDKVDATLHLKKSAASDYYFLNKFDLKVQTLNQAEAVSQTFYLTRKPNVGEEGAEVKHKQENKYTLKEGYNLLAGRPVHKDLVSNEGQEYQAWVKLNFKNQLNNGNYEMKQYTANYGFELQNVLSKYPIKELASEQYKKSLIESLNRGNLQKVTFVDGNGKEEKLFISPAITLGSLNVYDLNKQRIPTETLVEKNFIGKELVDKLRERMRQQQKPTVSEKPGQEQKDSVGQVHKHAEKQKEESPVKRQTRKHKVK